MLKNNKNILVVAAHPDDEIIGCGATIARLIEEGYNTYVLILSEGVASRHSMEKGNNELEEQIKILKKEAIKANDKIGVKDVFFYDFPDNQFDSVTFLDIVKVVSRIKEKIQPKLIFTHYFNDLNIDHQTTYRATITAARPLPEDNTREIFSFEILSSTEWMYPLSFSADVFFDITFTLDKKIAALNEYITEMRSYPHPRSIEGIKFNASLWGMKTGVKFAEAFKLVRSIR